MADAAKLTEVVLDFLAGTGEYFSENSIRCEDDPITETVTFDGTFKIEELKAAIAKHLVEGGE